MNKMEAEYARHLENERIGGAISAWAFQPEKLRLADRTFYEPDFRVIENDGAIRFDEVKGFMEDDAAVKLKVAAEQHPYRFLLVRVRPKKNGGGWVRTEI